MLSNYNIANILAISYVVAVAHDTVSVMVFGMGISRVVERSSVLLVGIWLLRVVIYLYYMLSDYTRR